MYQINPKLVWWTLTWYISNSKLFLNYLLYSLCNSSHIFKFREFFAFLSRKMRISFDEFYYQHYFILVFLSNKNISLLLYSILISIFNEMYIHSFINNIQTNIISM